MGRTSHRMILRHHPLFGQWHVPNLRAYVPHERGYFVVKTNRDGMRASVDHEIHRSGNRYRILLFGDSYTAGDGVHNEERYSDLMEKIWPGTEVLNFGVNSSGIDQQVLILEQLGVRFESDLILFCPLVENIRRNQLRFWHGLDRTTGQSVLVPKPYFTLQEGELRLHHVPVPKERIFLAEAPEELKRVFHFKEREMNFTDVLSEGLTPVRDAFRRWSRYQPYPEYDSPESPEWLLTKELLKRVIHLAGSRQVVLAPLPNFYTIEGISPPTYRERFREFAREHPEVRFLDLLPYFLELSRAERISCRYPHDVHYTPLGHSVVARALVAELKKLRLTAPKAESVEVSA